MSARFLHVDVTQRSPEWIAARLGRLTSTGAADVLAAPLKKGGESASRRNLRVRLALERLTGRSIEREFVSPAMKTGIDREADAFAAYEAATGALLQRSGFLRHPELAAGTSLDGHVDDYAGVVELKSPQPATHLEYLRTDAIPADYRAQITHHLWITGAAWCDWVSYQPDFPSGLQLLIRRVRREDVDLTAYELAARLFLSEVEQEVSAIQALRAQEGTAA